MTKLPRAHVGHRVKARAGGTPGYQELRADFDDGHRHQGEILKAGAAATPSVGWSRVFGQTLFFVILHIQMLIVWNIYLHFRL